MLRQLGKPTFFITLSASETQWDDLIRTLYLLKHSKKLTKELTSFEKSTLVSEDPVVCVLYFEKLGNIILRILQSKVHSPFQNHYITDFF